MLARIFSISSLVKARSVCVRMLPSMSADSNTLAAVSSSGAANAYLVVLTERPVHVLESDSLRLHLRSPLSYSLRRLLSSVNSLIRELHQADVCCHDV